MCDIRGFMGVAALFEQLGYGIVAGRLACAAQGDGPVQLAQVHAAEMVREIGGAEPEYLPDETHARMIALLP
jgi:hypothetical protein